MTDSEFAAILRGTKIDGFRRTYHDLPAEHREWAHYTTFDGFNRGYHVWDLTPSRVEWWAQQYWEQTAGKPAMSPELD